MKEERLQKFMARCGTASRRKCEELILEGRVMINGQPAAELGIKVNPEHDRVTFDGKLISPEESKVYIALNKPVGYLSTVKDERNRKTILHLVKVKERIYPIGRLDYDTSGLILLTNDGEAYNNVIHPRVEVKKTYIATVQGVPSKDDLSRFEKGLDIGGYITAPAEIKLLSTGKDSSRLKIVIHEGKNRQVRRMCEAIEHPVIDLRRVSVGAIGLGNLETGQWRHLSENEVKYLKELR